jgi:hypothetical protein
MQEDFTDISIDELDHVTGDARAQRQPQSSGGLFGWLDGIYKNIVFHFASHIGGPKLADRLYGQHATAKDHARAETAMKKFLADGHKLPKGVPNLFG